MSKRKTHSREENSIKRAEETIEAFTAEVVPSGPGTTEKSAVPWKAREISVNEQKAHEIRNIEDGIYSGALKIVEDSMYWPEVDPTSDEPPAAWVEALGPERARQRFRTAKANWLSAKEAPIGIRTATMVSLGITKARSMEKQAPRSLNVSFVQMSAPLPNFPEIEVERNDR